MMGMTPNAAGPFKLGMVRSRVCKGARFCPEADEAKKDADGSGEEDEGEGEPLEIEAGVPLLPWNILVTWPPGDLQLLFRTHSQPERSTESALKPTDGIHPKAVTFSSGESPGGCVLLPLVCNRYTTHPVLELDSGGCRGGGDEEEEEARAAPAHRPPAAPKVAAGGRRL